jgi:hypothetical protein
MRFYRKPPAKPPAPGDVRTRTAFLLWPKRIGDEVRWLEHTTWEERAYMGYGDAPDLPAGYRMMVLKWRPVRWVYA